MRLKRYLFLLVFFAFALTSCSKYTYITAKQAQVHKGARIAVVVQDDISTESPSLLNDYLIAALSQKGHTVTVFNVNYLLGDDLTKILYPEGAYSFGKAVTEGVAAGGKITGDAKDVRTEILQRTEVSDALLRLRQLERIKKVLIQSGIDHLLVVRRFDFYGFSAQVVELEKMRVISSLAFKGNEIGFKKVVTKHNLGAKGAYTEPGDISRLELLHMASLIASGM